MIKTLLLLFALIVFAMTSRPPQSTLGSFADQTDVGTPLHAGTATYDSETQSYTIAGAGTKHVGWSRRVSFHMAKTER